jgi:hypothetical protein
VRRHQDGRHGVPRLNGTGPSVSSLQRVPVIIAAILLMLHWAAPSFVPLNVVPQPRDATPAFSAGAGIAPAGTLPRALARTHAFETGLPKSGRALLPPGAKSHDLVPAAAAVAGAPPAAIAEPAAFGGAPRATSRAHQFEARAPPPPIA